METSQHMRLRSLLQTRARVNSKFERMVPSHTIHHTRKQTLLDNPNNHRQNLDLLARLSETNQNAPARRSTIKERPRREFLTLQNHSNIYRKYSQRKMTLPSRSKSKRHQHNNSTIQRLNTVSSLKTFDSNDRNSSKKSKAIKNQLQQNHYAVCDYDLNQVMVMTNSGSVQSLQDVFLDGVQLLLEYDRKNQSNYLQLAFSKFKYIQTEIGPLSLKNDAYLGLCQGYKENFAESARLLARVLTRVGRFELLRLTHKQLSNPKLGYSSFYFSLAQAYQKTLNLLSSLQILQLWQKTVLRGKSEENALRKGSNCLRKPSGSFIDRKFIRTQNQDLGLIVYKGRLLKARVFSEMKNIKQSIQEYQICLSQYGIAFFNMQAYFELAWLYHLSQMPQKAAELLNEAEIIANRVRPVQLSYIKLQKAIILLENNNFKQAQDILEKINQVSLNSQVAYFKGYSIFKKLMIKNFSSQLIFTQKAINYFSDAILHNSCNLTVVKAHQCKALLLLLLKDFYGAQYEADRLQNIQQTKTSVILHTNIALRILSSVMDILKNKLHKGTQILQECLLQIKGLKNDSILQQLICICLQFLSYSHCLLRNFKKSLIYLKEIKHKYSYSDLVCMNLLLVQSLQLISNGKHTQAIIKLSDAQNLHFKLNLSKDENKINIKCLPINNNNRILLVKSVCYIQLYNTLIVQNDDRLSENKEILLSTEQMLMRCLLTQKQNFEIHYLLAVIHYQLEQYQLCLRHIRSAIQHSDDHMIKHYYLKATCKLLIERPDQAVKEYSNALIVQSQMNFEKQPSQQFYQTHQKFINDIHFYRALASLKSAFTFSDPIEYDKSRIQRYTYLQKALNDLSQFIKHKIDDPSLKQLIQKAFWMFIYAGQPEAVLKFVSQSKRKAELFLNDQVLLAAYYTAKQLNTCLSHMKKMLQKQRKKIQDQYYYCLQYDYTVLLQLKDSSDCSKNSLQRALKNLMKLVDLKKPQEGTIFKYSDTLFYIGVLYFHLQDYNQALSYFNLSKEIKTCAKMLFSIKNYCNLESPFLEVFEDRTYSAQQIEYNIGLCYLMENNSEIASKYLSQFSAFKQLLVQNKQMSIIQISQTEIDITPFPITDRLCSIYPQISLGIYKFCLSFCLPCITLPTLDLFKPGQQQLIKVTNSSKIHQNIPNKRNLHNIIKDVSLADIQMRPIAPWIKMRGEGLAFTDNPYSESVDLLSERSSNSKNQSPNKNYRYD